MTVHSANVADYKKYEWLMKFGSSDIWYEKPSKSLLKDDRALEAKLLPLHNARPVCLDRPKVWASAAMTTLKDGNVFECVAKHRVDDGYADSGTCHQCTEANSEALESTPLIYCLVFSTCQASDPFIHGAHFNGRQIYKLFECGSREAAVAEAFYAAGVNGWSLVFSCVKKLVDNSEERFGPAKKVNRLWLLAEEEHGEKTAKVFY
jgi:hypothetical protein